MSPAVSFKLRSEAHVSIAVDSKVCSEAHVSPAANFRFRSEAHVSVAVDSKVCSEAHVSLGTDRMVPLKWSALGTGQTGADDRG